MFSPLAEPFEVQPQAKLIWKGLTQKNVRKTGHLYGL